MNFMAVNELKSPRKLRARLKRDKEILLTNNGKPMAVLLNIGEGEDPESVLNAARAARTQMALRRIREQARDRGVHRMGTADLDRIIAKTRKSSSRR